MKLLGLEITKLENTPLTVTVGCYHCGKKFVVGIEYVRAFNYCPSC